MNFENWDDSSKRIVLYGITLFLAGLALGGYLHIIIQGWLILVLFIILTVIFFFFEYRKAGILGAITYASMILTPLALGFAIFDFFTWLF